jgi:TetR/AcrR family tetracycline transcriptional repressor
LDRRRIVTEAVALLDADGLEGVTLRKLAQRLGVQAPTLYWHLPNKAALVTAIAEEILEQQFPETSLVPPGADQRWQDWLADVAQRLRRAMLAHPDGARVVPAPGLRTVDDLFRDCLQLIIDPPPVTNEKEDDGREASADDSPAC